MGLAFVYLMVAALVLVLPTWPWSRGWGWAPTGMLGIILGTTLLFAWTGGFLT